MINISKILKDAPQGMKLYSPLFGEVEFCAVDTADSTIVVRTEHGDKEWFSMTGKYKINKSHFLYSDSECLLFPSKECRDWETWLLPTKPMFKVGDWVVDQTFAGPEGYIGEVGIIEGVTMTMLSDAKKENYYAIRGTDGKLLGGTNVLVCEYYLRPWTIEDAKDGDVLVCYSEAKGSPIEQVGIFKQYVGRHGGCSNTFLAHTGIDWDGNIIINGYMGSTNILPATKEQRDLFFKKIQEAGYQWDTDKKELRKIIKPDFKVGDWIVRGEGFVYEPSLITEIRDYYICELLNGERVTYTLNDVHKNFHLWAIQDAKDGDVLSVDFNGFQKIVIFKSLSDKGVEGYGITAFKDCVDFPTSYGKEYYSKTWTKTLTPATKEQRNRLFTELEKAGYKWDAEKKELRKIQHYDIANFHAGMPVLVRETSLNAWQYVPFSHCYIGGDGSTLFNAGLVGFTQCIPFEGNEHLLGTTNMPDECYINW